MAFTEKVPFRTPSVMGVIIPLLVNAVVFGYLYGTLETRVDTNIKSLAIISADTKTIPERLARIETILQQLVNREN